MEYRCVYADNAATTGVSESVLQVMLPVLAEQYGNPSSAHKMGREASRLILAAAQQAASALGCKPNEIYFTSGGTESDNWALRSAARLGAECGKRHIVTTMIEHHAVLKCCGELEKQGFEVTYLRPDAQGRITAGQVEAALREDSCLVSVMAANNEVGTIQPVAEIGALCRSRGVLFHTDAVQAVGSIPIDTAAMNVDMLSLSGHKIHAPKGVGALYIRSGVALPPFMLGGEQQRGRRAGTENTAGIVGLGQALADIPSARLNGHPSERLCGNVNISLDGVDGESLLLMLDAAGICASSGAACASGSLEPSHVLTAMGLNGQLARGSLRLTLGDDTTEDDEQYIIEKVAAAAARICEL